MVKKEEEAEWKFFSLKSEDTKDSKNFLKLRKRSPDDAEDVREKIESGSAEIISPPAKKQRTFMAYVLISNKAPPELLAIQEMNKKMAKMKNPKVKTNENLNLNVDTVRERLRNGPGLDLYKISLEKSIRDECVTRLFIASTYGGNPQATAPTIRPKLLKKHGLSDWLFCNLGHHPQGPQVPGAPGLMYSIDGDTDYWPGTRRLFTRIMVSPALWQYMGQYTMARALPLSKEEWAGQDPKVHRTWGTQLCRYGFGDVIQARISMRRQLQRDPTEEETQGCQKNKAFKHITPDDVISAFMEGEEIISIWTLKCVGYEAHFQRKIVEEFSTWVRPPPKTKKAKKQDSESLSRKKQEKKPISKEEDNGETESESIELSD